METYVASKSDTGQRVKNIIIEKLGIDECEIPDNALFKSDLGIDSLDLYEIFMEIEKELDIKIPDEDAGKLKTVDSVIYYVMNRTS